MADADAELTQLREQAKNYLHYADLVRTVHYYRADRRAWLNQVTGGLTVLAAAIVSTGILTHDKTHAGFWLTLAGGVVAFFAAVLAGLQSFYKFGEVAEKHRTAAADYGNTRMQLELFLVRYTGQGSSQQEAAIKDLTQLAQQIYDLDRKGPGFPADLYYSAKELHGKLTWVQARKIWRLWKKRRRRAPSRVSAAPLIHFLVVYDHREQKLLRADPHEDASVAAEAYAAIEEQHRGDAELEIVLMAADSLDT